MKQTQVWIDHLEMGKARFDLVQYLQETDAAFARIQANIEKSQQIVDEVFEYCDTDPEQRRFEGRPAKTLDRQVLGPLDLMLANLGFEEVA